MRPGTVQCTERLKQYVIYFKNLNYNVFLNIVGYINDLHCINRSRHPHAFIITPPPPPVACLEVVDKVLRDVGKQVLILINCNDFVIYFKFIV